MTEFTSRSRVLCALEHREPDRIPVDFASTRSSGINALAYGKLLQHLQLPLDNVVFDMRQLLSETDDQVRRLMGGDIIQLHRLAPSMGVALNRGYRPETLMDGSTAQVPSGFHYEKQGDGSAVIRNAKGVVTFKRPEGGLFFDDMYHPLEGVDTEDGIDAKMSLPEISAEELDYLKKRAKELYEETPYAVIGTTSTSLFERGAKDFGYESYLENLIAEPELVEYYLDKLTTAYIGMLDTYLDAVGDYLQIIQLHDDYGAQNSLLISPNVFRNVLKPFHTKIHRFIKAKKPHLKIFFHCCGAIVPLIPDLIDAGIDILNPIQIAAAGMDPRHLKKEFGASLVFWGGSCSTQTTMTTKSAEAVRKEAGEMIKIFAPGGGFVFCQDHNIQATIPPENIAALYKAAKDFGRYPVL
ncbi:uroporphyrinogen decarboxylase [Spirochaetia bacterium]|nr:uroporphyrinogen decarboxylase [Spirochaetia bacterium]